MPRDPYLTLVPDDEPDAVVVAMDDLVDAPLPPAELALGSDVLDLESMQRELDPREAPTKTTRLVVRTDDREGLRRE